MTITQSVKTMQEQNKIFEEMEPNIYKRVALMAADIKQTIKERQQKQRRRESQLYVSKWNHH